MDYEIIVNHSKKHYMQLSHKIALETNQEIEIFFAKACGCARFAYNWGLSKWKSMYQTWLGDNTKPKPSAKLIKKLFNEIKEEEFPWIYDSPKDANQQAFAYLDKAFSAFFKQVSKYPKFHKKGRKDSFYISNDKFRIEDGYVVLPKIGRVKMTEPLRFEGKINGAVISRHADTWFISINMQPIKYKRERTDSDIVALDVGVKSVYVDSKGNNVVSPKPLRENLKKLARAQRRLSRRKVGSNNREKAKRQVTRIHARVKNIRSDFTHKLTNKICSENQVIILEDLTCKNWLKMFGKSAADNCVGELRRQIKYKAELYDGSVVMIDRWEPTSKTCSCCGWVNKDLTLANRTFQCKICNMVKDRDENAAINIHTLGYRGIYACGLFTSGVSLAHSKLEGGNKNLLSLNGSL
jgi:putative transposase